MTDQPCEFCAQNVPSAAERCPHCALPGLFPNLRAAERPENRRALQERYESALRTAEAQDRLATLRAFQDALGSSVAVIARSTLEVERLATSERQGYASYYQLIDAEVRLPDDNTWDSLRRMADAAIFPGYEKQIRFAALSLDGLSLKNYGECSLVCAETMIRHRASALEENSTLFFTRDLSLAIDTKLLGHRATYADRALLCVAKLAGRMKEMASIQDFAELLMRSGADSGGDDFVEIHIWGPMTIRTFAKVLLRRAHARRRTFVKALRERLAAFGVELEVR